MVNVRSAAAADAAAVAEVHRQAFGGPDEAALVAALDAGGHTALSLVAESRSAVVGHVLLSPLQWTGDGRLLALAPLGVLPAHQRQGIGSALMRAALEWALAAGYRAAVVLGDPAYYTRFGLSVAAAAGVRCPYSGEHLLAADFHPERGPLAGEAAYAPPFAAL